MNTPKYSREPIETAKTMTLGLNKVRSLMDTFSRWALRAAMVPAYPGRWYRSDVLPIDASCYRVGSSIPYPEHLGQFEVANAFSVQLSHFSHFFFSENCPSRTLAAIVWRKFSPFSKSIEHVLSASADEQMVRTNARWSVARMEYELSLRNGANADLPRHAVSRNRVVIYLKNAVTSFIESAYPKPAIPSFIDKFPETIFQGRVWSSRAPRVATLPITGLRAIPSFIARMVGEHAFAV